MPAGPTFTKIETKPFSGATETVFNSISGEYTDLYILFDGVGSNVTNLVLRFNGDTGANYSFRFVLGNGSAIDNSRQVNDSWGSLTAIYTTRTVCSVSIQNYSNTTTRKSYLGRTGNAANQTTMFVGMWRSTAAITSVSIIKANGGTMDGKATLYGIKAA